VSRVYIYILTQSNPSVMFLCISFKFNSISDLHTTLTISQEISIYQIRYLSLLCGIQILTDVIATSTVFCYTTLCGSVEIYGCFERISGLFLQATRSARNACKLLLFYNICLYSRSRVAVTCKCEFWPFSMYNISLKNTGPFRHS